MVKPIKSSSTTPSTQAPLSVDAIFQQLSTMQQLQLYVRESLLRVVLPSLSIMKQQASNAASSVDHDDDEISQMIANSHLKQHSSDDQKQAFEELMAQICNELNIKHRLETRSQLDTDDAVNEHMDSLYQKIFEKVQPKSQNINSSSSSDDSSSMTRSTSSAAAKVEEKKRKKLTKEREQELQLTIKSFSDDSIQKCVTFLKKEAAALTPTHGGSVSALRIHSLLFQLTVHQKYNKIMECGIVHVWISPVLKNGPPMSVIKFMCIQWYTLLMSVYRAVVARAAQVNYIQNTQRQEREKQEAETGGATQASNKNVNKENRKKKPQQQIEEEEELDEMDDEDFDPEKAMFGEDKKESEESTNTDPNSFDEENVSALLKMKQQLLNKESLRSAIDFVLNQTPNRRETVAWSYIVFMCLQLLTDALNSTTSQDRFEQFVDLLSDINVIDLFSDLLDSDMIQKASELGGAVVDNKFRIDYREIVENSLYTLSVMMNHEHTIPQSFLQYVCDAAIAVLYAFTDPEADSKEEHNICNDVYIVSLCCYIIAKVCGKSSKITNQVVKKYCLQPSAEEDLLARLVSLIKYKKPIFVNINSNTTNQRRPLVMNAYATLSSLIKNKGLAQRVIAMEEHDDQKKDYSLVDTLVADINGQKGDTNAWELRYSAMVLLKYFSLLIKPYKNAGPIFSKLLEANVIETMVTHLTNRNKAKKKGQKTEDETDGFLHHRYLLPSTLAALNSLFHNAKENGDPTNIDTLKTIVATNEDFQGILSFLSAMERQKVETGIPYWLIMILVVVFVVFLILIPIFYNFARPSVNRG